MVKISKERFMSWNEQLLRRNMLISSTNPIKDIEKECGHPDLLEEIKVESFSQMVSRDGIARRINRLFPEECWKSPPEIYEVEDETTKTPFEQAWQDLPKGLRSDGLTEGFFNGQEGNPVIEILQRLDELCGIGRYGIMLFGLGDGQFKTPATKGATKKLAYLRVFDESCVTTPILEMDRRNIRYGWPVEYHVLLANGETIDVHWTRVLHVADNLMSSEMLGEPRLRVHWNRVLDLRKLLGGSAEMYWKGAWNGMGLQAVPDSVTGEVDIDPEDLAEEMQKFYDGLTRYFAVKNMVPHSMQPNVSDPTAQIEVQKDAICIGLNVPKRIFEGSEMGELASSQDTGHWNDRVRYRQNTFCTPRILVPFVERLIWYGILPPPKEFFVRWKALDALSDAEKADIALKKTQTLAAYLKGDVENLIEPVEYLVKVFGMSKEDAEEVASDALARLAAADAAEQQATTDQIKAKADAMGEMKPPLAGSPQKGAGAKSRPPSVF